MVYMYHSFLIHLSADGHLGCFHVLAMINSAVMNIGGARVSFRSVGYLFVCLMAIWISSLENPYLVLQLGVLFFCFLMLIYKSCLYMLDIYNPIFYQSYHLQIFSPIH